MDTEVRGVDASGRVAFVRLHALAGRGFRPLFTKDVPHQEISSVELRHSKVRGENAPPPITLWSNGIVTTTSVLWPKECVDIDGDTPPWQKFTDSTDEVGFAQFVVQVPRPSLYDRYVSPTSRQVRITSFMAIFGVTLCCILGLAFRLIPAAFSTFS